MSTNPEQAAPPIQLGWSSQRLNLRDGKEDWTGLTNPAERRKLQNRLNQRARRLRAHGKVSGDSLSLSTGSSYGRSVPQATPKRKNPVALNSSRTGSVDAVAVTKRACLNASPQVEALMSRFADHAYMNYMQGTPAVSHLALLVKYNVSSALKRNAALLGLTSEYYDYNGISPFNKQGPSLGFTSSCHSADWPINLQPTELQRSIEHHPWVDVFPWPRVRDNLLQAFAHPELCDEDDLCHDVCEYDDPESKPALIVWGVPWDPRSWEVSREFLAKWGWLLSGCKEVLEATNYWRARRGENLITAREFCQAIHASVPKQASYTEL